MARGNLVFSSGNEASTAGCPIGQSIMAIVETCLVETCQCLTAVKSAKIEQKGADRAGEREKQREQQSSKVSGTDSHRQTLTMDPES
ncbi:hypothetical protein NQZ68_017447 [Dissostichus eleginoides]|nr:hypothetical protein NQZ68_017447 [Dissostichus eleginoides]